MRTTRICLVDKFLLVFLSALFIYTAFTLFTGTIVTESTKTVDILVRASSASIFGYFISSNFVKSHSDSGMGSPEAAGTDQVAGCGNDGTGSNEGTGGTGAAETAAPAPQAPDQVKCNSPQVIIVSLIGLVSMILMFLSNKYADAAPHAAATIAQLRDFVSACVGYLVSCGKSH